MSIVKFNISELKVTILSKNNILFIGPLGKSNLILNTMVNITLDNKSNLIISSSQEKNTYMINTYKKLINNIIIGITEGYTKRLKLEGIGYKVYKKNDKLIFKLGHSHDIIYEIPSTIQIEIINPNLIEIKSINKIEIGQCIANIKRLRKTNPYRIKGIYCAYAEEIKIKATKKK